MRDLEDFMPLYEFSERHRIAIEAPAERIDQALRRISLADLPAARALWFVRRLGRRSGDPTRPLVEGLPGVVLEDVPGEGVVVGLVGQFWRLRATRDLERPRSIDAFLADSRPDSCKAVISFRVGPRSLSTETRVHVADPAARRKFRRDWRVIRPFSGLTRILFLRAARRQAEVAE